MHLHVFGEVDSGFTNAVCLVDIDLTQQNSQGKQMTRKDEHGYNSS